MTKGKIRHMFPGGNTSKGFFSYYNYILTQEEATRIMVIKGGPGVGKSTFMKKIGEEMVERGYDIEHMHCSSDPNSLDGLVIPSIRVALLDGTAPHVVDPKNPGGVDEIIHLGDFWREEGLRTNKEGIIKDNKEIGRIFAQAYRYIKAAAHVYENIAAINNSALDSARINITAAKIISELLGNKPVADKEGRQRHLFASAITPLGLKNYLESLLTVEKIYAIKGGPGTGTEKLLEKVRAAAVERGFYVESYYCALYPDKLEHIIIPEIDAALTTSNEYHSADIDCHEELNFNEFLDNALLEKYREDLEYDKVLFDELINRAVGTISKAKALHDHLETYYIPNMDFEAVQRCMESTLARILEYATEFN